MKNHRFFGLILAAALSPGLASAAGGSGYVEDIEFSFEGPFGTFDRMQLQRGFQVFQEVCSGCHGLKFVSFRELGMENGPAFPPEQVEAIAALYDVPDPDGEPGDTRTGIPSDRFPANDAVGAPDLSLMAKARAGFHGPSGLGINQLVKGIGGPEYIYSLLTNYTGEDVEVAGNILYKNETYPGGLISMSQPLWGDDVEYLAHGDENGTYTPPEATIEQQAEDVSAFLMWAAEPHMVERKEAGFRNLIWLIILSVLLYYTNKAIWANIKKKS
ncbi:MAG: cytochrome c1 [Pseudomonadota bacterium]